MITTDSKSKRAHIQSILNFQLGGKRYLKNNCTTSILNKTKGHKKGIQKVARWIPIVYRSINWIK